MNRLDRALGRLLAAWVDGVRRRAVLVVVLVLAVSAVAGVRAQRHLGVNADLAQMLSPDLPFRQLEQQFFANFPMYRDPLLLVVDGASPDLAEDAARALAAALEARPEVFRSVFLPGGGRFFERHALLYLEVGELEELADHLAQVQPYVAELSRDGSLRGLLSLLGDALASAPGDESVDLEQVLGRFREALDANLEGRPYQLPWTELLLGHAPHADSRRRLLVADPVLDYGDMLPARAAIATAREAIRSLGLDADARVRVRITGDAALSYEEMSLVEGEARSAGIVSLVLVALILLGALRSPRLVLAVLLTLVVGLVWTAAFASLAVGHLNPVSVAFAVLFIGLGVDFGVHLAIPYRERLGLGRSRERALRDVARRVGSSLVLCAATTAIGFYAFVPTAYLGVAELGLISGTGMFVSLFLTLTFMPALLSLGRPPRRPPRAAPRRLAMRLLTLPERRAGAVRAGALLLGLGSVALLGEVHFEHNPLALRDPSAESVSALEDLLAEGSASPWNLNVLVRDAESARRVATRLRELPAVDRTLSLVDLVPADQPEKLAILEDVALFMGPSLGSDRTRPPPAPAEQLAALHGFGTRLDEALAGELPPEQRATRTDLRESLTRFLEPDGDAPVAARSVAALEESLLGSLPERLRRLHTSLTPGPVALADLPGDLVQQLVGADGRLRVEVFPRDDLSRDGALEDFVSAVHSVAPDAIGGGVTILESARAVVRSLQQALGMALLAITLLLLALWRSALDALLVIAPLALAALLTAAASVLLDIPLNFADVIVIPLLLGIGVDSGIHLVHRHRHPGARGEHLLATSTARAVLVSAFTTVASFGSLGLSTHPGMASLGQLLTVGLSLTLLCNLVVLPALIPARRRAATR